MREDQVLATDARAIATGLGPGAPWPDADSDLADWLNAHARAAVDAYRADPLLVSEHANQEDAYRTGGYAARQLQELVQNGADALQRTSARGRVELRLANGSLYCANEGEPFTQQGVEAVCHSFLSSKRGDEIGRFGLGFKSVLAVSDRPQVLSRTVSFGFDREMSRRQLEGVAGPGKPVPALRLPELLDHRVEIQHDPVLRELSGWAQTVVRLPLRGDFGRLRVEMREFPVEFLLFAPGISVLRIAIDDAATGFDKELRCVQLDDGAVRLEDGPGGGGSWRVWHRHHLPSAHAQAELPEALRRDRIRVSYAAPLDVRGTGTFWAYFPLADRTSTTGILNAPWRTNDDRTSLLPGIFNQEILDVIADLVIKAMPSLSTPEDPARHFDYLPARGREWLNFADRRLTETIPERAARTSCIPDGMGELQPPWLLRMLKVDVPIGPETYQRWSAAPGCPVNSPHPSCYTTATRRTRLRSLVRQVESQAAKVEVKPASWLEMLVSDCTDEQCASTLDVLATVTDSNVQAQMISARVLPDERGGMHRLTDTSKVFLEGHILSGSAKIDLVRSSFLAFPGVRQILERLGFEKVDAVRELRHMLSGHNRGWHDREWRAFWECVDDVTVKEANGLLAGEADDGFRLRVSCRDGRWHSIGEAVAPGVVSPVRSALTLDVHFHQNQLELLKKLGFGERPTVGSFVRHDPTYQEYLRLLNEKLVPKVRPAARKRPNQIALRFEKPDGVGPLHILRRFADSHDTAARLAWSRELLEVEAAEEERLEVVGEPDHPGFRFAAPHLWAVNSYGLLATSWGPRPARRTVSPALVEFAPLLPIAEWSVARKLKLTSRLDEVSAETWNEFLDRVPERADPFALGRLLAAAAAHLPEAPARIPALLAAQGALARRDEVLVARTQDEIRGLTAGRHPYVAVQTDVGADLLDRQWGCRPAASHLQVELVANASGETVLVLDRFRGLRAIAADQLADVLLTACEDLARQVTTPQGTDQEPLEFARRGTTVYYLSSLDDAALLDALGQEFGFALSTGDIASIRDERQSDEVQAAIAACRIEGDPARKLLHLLSVAELETKLPSGLLKNIGLMGGSVDDLEVARLALDVHGDDTVWQYRHELRDRGFPVPDRWAGSAPAVAFVRRLGFPAEYAGEEGRRLDANMTVEGPPRLEGLHAYQVKLAGRIRDLITRPERALLYLPTGAGKTRVTVQALVHGFVEDGLTGPVLWIAQSEELCEQAVQTWSVVWREFGDRRPLRLCRLWSANEVAQSEDEIFVVVATDAKLAHCRNDADYSWLSNPSVVVIDEAHEATGKDYTATLRWLGLDAQRTSRPLLGLTATPFKGTSEEATRRLAARFGNNMLDELGDDPYRALQDVGVLSRIRHRILDGTDVRLDAREAEHVRTTRLLPQAVLDRVGKDEARTVRLVDDIRTLPGDWPVLVFTSSVLSAQTLAAILRVHGMKAASVSGDTRPAERRRTIERFRSGEIQVLANCNVLTQGFDAPGVRALYIARPTFSPNAYIQMIGRGLRGPANGGKDECLIVNVADTFGQFGERLAYQEFQELWTRQGDGAT